MTPTMYKTRASGFSLIELMIAIAIVAILAGIALPSYTRYVDRSIMRTAQADLVALSLAVENVFQRTLAYPKNDPAVDATTVFTTWSPATDDGDYKFFILSHSTNNITHLDSSSQPGYVLTATPQGGRAALANCAIQLDMKNGRKVGAGSCIYGNSWL